MNRTYVWYNGVLVEEAKDTTLEEQIAEVCGLVNAAVGQLVALIAQVLEDEAWEGVGVRTAEQWVAWKCGVSLSRARRLVTMARRLKELPETKAAMEAGELCEDQVAVICRHAPPTSTARPPSWPVPPPWPNSVGCWAATCSRRRSRLRPTSPTSLAG